MIEGRSDADVKYPPWRTAALPLFALLGAALPLYFLTLLEQYLYYLRPSELLPTYGTAWLFLAAPAIPAWLIGGALLELLQASGKTRNVHRWAAMGLVGTAGAAVIAGLLYCTLIWIRTYGILVDTSFGSQLALIAVALGTFVTITKTGRSFVASLRPIMMWCTVLGALSVLTVPLFDWRHESPNGSRSDLPANPALRGSPNIVLLTIDTLSAQHMSLYGATRPTTPTLAAFAKGAVVFDHAYANSNFTTVGVSSILTGTRPWTHRALQQPSWPLIDARRASLPALLSRNGYLTGYVSTNPDAGAAKNGMSNYFDHASRDRIRDVFLCSEHLSSLLKYACAAAELPLFGEAQRLVERIRKRSDNLQFDPRLATDSAVDWLRSINKDKPVFLWVHLVPPHSPYAAPEPWIGHFDSTGEARLAVNSEPNWGFLLGDLPQKRVHTLEARYDESVEYVDHYAGEFLQQVLHILGDNTAVVVTADHGESFGHGYGAHSGPGLYDEIIHVPLILRFPRQREGLRSDILAEQVDIAPTLMQLAGIKPPPTWEGVSLLGAWSNSGAAPIDTPDRPVFSMNFEENPRASNLITGSVAVIDGHWKLVRYFGALHYALMPRLRDTLYDLSIDPGELLNRTETEPEVTHRLSNLIATELAGHGGPVR
jgi:arylsulfatase A-like enzyme